MQFPKFSNKPILKNPIRPPKSQSIILILTNPNSLTHEKRIFGGQFTFKALKTYLSVFATKNSKSRSLDPSDSEKFREAKNSQGQGFGPGKGSGVRLGHIETLDVDFDGLAGVLRKNSDGGVVVLLHVVDTLSLDYPNLILFQERFGNLVRYLRFNANTLAKKGQVGRIAEGGKTTRTRPFVVAYGKGNYDQKINGKQVFDSFSSFDKLLSFVYENLPSGGLREVGVGELSREAQTAFEKRKLAAVLLYEGDEVSMSYRVLAAKKKYRDRVEFLVVKNPEKTELLENLGIDKTPRLLMFHPGKEDFLRAEFLD